MRTLALPLLVLVLAGATACGDEVEAPTPSGPLDRLTLRLELDSERVAAGGTVESHLVVENGTDEPVTDEPCDLVAPSFAITDPDDGASELWQQLIVDCGAPIVVPARSSRRLDGPSFQASDKRGKALAPGEYVARLKIVGHSSPIEQPIVVTR